MSTLFYTQNKTNGIPLLNDPWMAVKEWKWDERW